MPRWPWPTGLAALHVARQPQRRRGRVAPAAARRRGRPRPDRRASALELLAGQAGLARRGGARALPGGGPLPVVPGPPLPTGDPPTTAAFAPPPLPHPAPRP